LEERETLEVDVLFVGAGPASLAGALHLARLAAEHDRHADTPLSLSIAVLEKGREITSHAISGAVFDPRALRELFPQEWEEAPFEGRVEREKLLFLTRGGATSLPIPPPLHNAGCYVASLGRLLKWMAPKVEAAGVDLFFEFPAVEPLFEAGRLVGVRTGDKGVGKTGARKANYEPGVDVRAQVTVFGEGPRGTIAKVLESRVNLNHGKNPQVYALGLKEVWDVPAGRMQPGEVIHTMGWPLGFHNFGGGFIYGMQNDQMIVGLVAGLDYRDPLFDPHAEFQRLKTHPRISRLLEGGKMAFYGAKAIPEGGWWSMPRPWGDGFLLVGDSAGMLNSQRLKGIHLAMKSGVLAAETIFEGMVAGGKEGVTARHLSAYPGKIEESWIRDELYPVRNFHQAFDHGFLGGMLQGAAGLVTGGRGWGIFDRLGTRAGHEWMRPFDSAQPTASARDRSLSGAEGPVAYDGKLTFDRLADVYNSGTAHEEDQPVHLHVADTSICVERCTAEFANPCQRFCPAAVYEMVADASVPQGRRLQINASNCVHCKTCDILDPYEIITWVPPEGGGGPSYSKM
jgi:electron-transferring-flavoprotein dehydrogenase